MEKSKNVFVSHYNKDEKNIGDLKELLSKKGYELKNSSIDSTKSNEANNPDYIKQLLRDRISWAGTFVCLIGPHTHERPWVDWEIEEANRQGKRIVGIYIEGARDSDVPGNFDKYGDTVVGWTTDNIIDALEGEDNNWKNPDGSDRPGKWGIPRREC